MTRNTNSYRGKGRALFLAALMVMSVIAVPFAFAGGAAAVSSDAVDESHRTVTGGETVYQGQEVAINVTDISDQDNIELRRVDDGEVGTLVSAPSVKDDGTEQYVVVDTTNRDTDQYVLTANGTGTTINSPDVTFEVVEMDVSASFDDGSVTDTGSNAETTFEIDSEIRNTYAVNVSADGLDDSDLFQIFNATGNLNIDNSSDVDNSYDIARADQSNSGYATIDEDDNTLTLFDAEGEWDVSFEDIAADDYDLNVEAVDTTASANDNVTVTEGSGGEVDFGEAVDVNKGDIAEITLTADNTDEGTLVIGDAEEVGYQANATIDFGGEDEITVYFNTYAAGSNSDGNVIWTDSDNDASITNFSQSTSSLGGLLASGYGYEMTAKAVNTGSLTDDAAETLDTPDNVGSVFIEERSTDSIDVWTASDRGDVISDITDKDTEEQPDAVKDAIDSDLVTQADTLAHGDTAIFQIKASGLAGMLSNASYNVSRLSAGTDHNGITDFGNNSQDESRVKFEVVKEASNPNADETTVPIDGNDITLVHDKYGVSDEYFVIVDTDDMGSLASDETHSLTVDFAVQDDRLLPSPDEDEDEDITDVYQSLDSDFSVEERTASLDVADSGLVEVEQTEDEITGETNIAPGSELTIRLRGTGDYRFSESQSEIVVQPDGTFAGEFDFNDREVDTTFTASLRSSGVDEDVEEDGVVVPAADEPEDGDEPPENDTDDGNMTDDDDMSDDDMSDDSTDDMSDDSTDDSSDDSTDEETPGFGALVALVALVGAALLATRRQN